MDLNLNAIPDEVLREILQLTELQAKQERQQRVHDSFMAFAHHVYEGFIEGVPPDHCREARAGGAWGAEAADHQHAPSPCS